MEGNGYRATGDRIFPDTMTAFLARKNKTVSLENYDNPLGGKRFHELVVRE